MLLKIEIGMDLDNLLNIKHYEKPIPANLRGQVRGGFPSNLVSKTDEIRIQSCPEVIDEIKNVPSYVTIKCDGTSSTYIFNDTNFYICSRNNMLKDNEENEKNVYVNMAHKYDIENKLRSLGKNLAIQGEICGPGIQANKMGLKELTLFGFNVFDIDHRKYMDYNDFKQVIEDLELLMVPLYLKDVLFEDFTIERFLELSKGTYPGTEKPREGIVIRPMIETYSYALKGRLSFKVINPEYGED